MLDKAFEIQQLTILGYRPKEITWQEHINKIALCVNRLRMGEKTWQLFAPDAKDPIVSQHLAQKVSRDYHNDKLNFLEEFPVTEREMARTDPDRIARYETVIEAENMAPYRFWNLKHMKGTLRMDHERALALIKEYDAIRAVRFEMEVTIDSFESETRDGTMVLIQIPQGKVMRKFRSLPRYLRMLYWMHYCTEYPGAPRQYFPRNLMEWIERAYTLRVSGRLVEKDDDLVTAADNIIRYEAWDYEEAYFESLPNPGNTKASHEKVVRNLKKRFGMEEGGNSG